MIEDSLSFTMLALNQYLQNFFGNQEKNVILNTVVNDDSTVPLSNQNKIVLSLINVENESAKPFYNRRQNLQNGSFTNVNPDERFNLDLLVTACFQDYNESLKFLNSTITFFQAHSSVDVTSFSFFPAILQKLEYELVKMTYDKMFDLWSAMGAKYKPSMVYKLKMITIQGGEVIDFEKGVTQIAKSVLPE